MRRANIYMNREIDQKLRSLADSDYKAFNERLITTGYETLGIRMPALKRLAKEIAAGPDPYLYLDNAEYTTYEHILLYGLVVGSLKKPSIETVFRYLDPLILRFDNWAHVDTVAALPKVFKEYPDEMLAHFMPLKTHEGEFTKRTFVILMMDHMMTEKHIDTMLKHLTEVPQGQYYVDMAIAWAISMALVKFYDKTVPLLKKPVFSKFVHNKAIQKARESYRITPPLKEELNAMKIR